MTSFTLEPVWADRPDSTQKIMLGEAVVGHLYSADDVSEGWEVWPRDGHRNLFPDFGHFRQKRNFADRKAAEAYLGIRQSVQEAA